jgi:hypothetical protein
MRKGYVMYATLLVVMISVMIIGYFIKNTQKNSSKEFNKELLTTRTYWALFSAKEFDSDKSYDYYPLSGGSNKIYTIDATKNIISANENKYSYQVTYTANNHIDTYERNMTINTTDLTIKSYKGD